MLVKKINLYTYVFVVIFSFATKAQDTLLFKTGEIQVVQFIEKNKSTLTYKKYDFVNGPNYIVNISELVSIKYKNGKKEYFEPNKNSNANYLPWMSNPNDPPVVKPYKKGGPRLGCTYIGEGDAAKKITDMGKYPFVSQIGWELEARLFRSNGGLDAVLEFNFLLAGMEQGMVLPSGNILLGLRGKEGLELAVGPNFSLSGLGMEFQIGSSLQWKDMNFPVSLSFVPSVRKTETTYSYTGKEHTETLETGFRITFLVGFYSKLR